MRILNKPIWVSLLWHGSKCTNCYFVNKFFSEFVFSVSCVCVCVFNCVDREICDELFRLNGNSNDNNKNIKLKWEEPSVNLHCEPSQWMCVGKLMDSLQSNHVKRQPVFIYIYIYIFTLLWKIILTWSIKTHSAWNMYDIDENGHIASLFIQRISFNVFAPLVGFFSVRCV